MLYIVKSLYLILLTAFQFCSASDISLENPEMEPDFRISRFAVELESTRANEGRLAYYAVNYSKVCCKL